MTSPPFEPTDLVIDDFDPLPPSVSDPDPREPTVENPFPKAMIAVGPVKLAEFTDYVQQWWQNLSASHAPKLSEWAKEEEAYNAAPDPSVWKPFDGASEMVVPLIAMAVDPIQARISLGMFKQDTLMKFKALRQKHAEKIDSLEQFYQFYQKNCLKLRSVYEPRLFEFAKHGTMVFETDYDRETTNVVTYDSTNSWKEVKREVTRFAGPRTRGVPLGDFMLPPYYEQLEDTPIHFRKLRFTWDQLKVLESQKRITNLAKIKGQTTNERNELEAETDDSNNHHSAGPMNLYYELWRVVVTYDINGDGVPEKLLGLYHYPTNTFLSLQYNWYHHQQSPYDLAPYSKASGSLYGLGIAKMTKPLQDALSDMERTAQDNAKLANVRMFITSKNSGLENRPKLFTGRVLRLDNPDKDFRSMQVHDIYPSTLTERQNMMGLAEKRNHVSDYLTGRESPLTGGRPTATGTVALISEGTKYVEQVMENVRELQISITSKHFSIWCQYGLDNILEQAFGEDSQITKDVRAFFADLTADNLVGALAIDLAATDSTNNKAVQQQMRMQIMQTLTGYYERFVQAAQLMVQYQAQSPELAAAIRETAEAARHAFRDLLQSFDVRNPDDYLPDLNKILPPPQSPGNVDGGAQGGISQLVASIGARAGLPAPNGAASMGPTQPPLALV